MANYLWACNGMIFNQYPGVQCKHSANILLPIQHLWNAKTGNNTGMMGNLKRTIGSFLGNKSIEY